jgi:hypothetical protein
MVALALMVQEPMVVVAAGLVAQPAWAERPPAPQAALPGQAPSLRVLVAMLSPVQTAVPAAITAAAALAATESVRRAMVALARLAWSTSSGRDA